LAIGGRAAQPIARTAVEFSEEIFSGWAAIGEGIGRGGDSLRGERLVWQFSKAKTRIDSS
jgi:hypothetical protein